MDPLAYLLVVGLIAFCLTFRLPPGPPPPNATADRPPIIRKLHLFRPDLIPYPMAYEVYC